MAWWNWPNTRTLFRGDSHHGRKEAMDWCDANGVDYIFGFAPNKVLAAQIFSKLDECCVQRAIGQLDTVRRFAGTRYAAKSWTRIRRIVARAGPVEVGSGLL